MTAIRSVGKSFPTFFSVELLRNIMVHETVNTVACHLVICKVLE